jgi:hypothetical protein
LVSASSSGNPINHPPENVLFSRSWNWFSKVSPNQSIPFQSMELEIENYRFHIWYECLPLGWLVEGRLHLNDQFIQIDKSWNEFVKENASPDDFVQITFQCQNPGNYSEFRFTMTDKNQQENHKFNLNSIELFGNLFEYHNFESNIHFNI